MQIIRTTFRICCLLAFRQFLQAAPPSGYVLEWGWNTSTGNAAPAMQVLSNAVAISAGRLHCLALKDDGTVVAWGGNFRGEPTFDNTLLTTGEGGFTDESGFHRTHTNTTKIMTNGIVRINGQVLGNIVAIAAGAGFSVGLRRDGTVTEWGENSVPIGPSNVVAIAAAGSTSLALKRDGTVIQWAAVKWSPDYGQFNEVPGLSNVIAVAIGNTSQGTRNVALKKNGTVASWGSETIYKDATPPAGLSNVVAVAAGGGQTLALRGDGTIIGWGFNKVGQATGVPTTNDPCISAGTEVRINGEILSNIVSIAAGRGYSMALKKDGTIVTWGRMVNDLYPVTVPAGLSNAVAISAGDNFCLAITTNSAVAAKFRQK
jgi:alpha-tubulin suppressor-like RCC1 family protein